MSLHGAILRKARKAAVMLRHYGPPALLWEVADRIAYPAVRAAEDVVWWRMRRPEAQDFCVSVLGHRMFLLRDDTGVSKELAVYGVHEPLATRVLSKIVGPGMHVVDIGSNVGYFLLIEARLVGRDGVVVGFEPEPANFRLLQRNVQANGYTNVILLNEAVGDQEAVASLSVARQSNWHSLTDVPWETVTRIPVEVVALDRVLEDLSFDRVDVVRMDIEGYERRALDGMRRTLDRSRPGLLAEIHPHLLDPTTLDEFFRDLQALSYDAAFVLDRRWDHRLHAWRLRPDRRTTAYLARDARVTLLRRTMAALFVHHDRADRIASLLNGVSGSSALSLGPGIQARA